MPQSRHDQRERSTLSSEYNQLVSRLEAAGTDTGAVESALRAQRVETPSWAYAGQGTRFSMFLQPGLPRDVLEKLEDAAEVHRLTGVCPSVAIHIPWDEVDDYSVLALQAERLGLEIGAINPNLFQDQDYRLGSIGHPDSAVRERACAELTRCVSIATACGSSALSLWLADGTNYPGQDSLVARRERVLECLIEVYAACSAANVELLVEYKPYEPAFYSTDIADWGSALLLCQRLGPLARVLVDLGHHTHGANIEQIVAILLSEGRLGGFHFNARRYGDDDLIVGTTNPLELFLIFLELGRLDELNFSSTIDQSLNIEPKIEGMLQSVSNLQEAYAKALIVDRAALEQAQAEGDVLGGHAIVMNAFRTDVRPLCAKVRTDLGGAADPIAEFHAGGYHERAVEARAGGVPASWQ